MTTILFEEDIRIKRNSFKNLSDFSEYIISNLKETKLYKLEEKDLNEDIIKWAKECRKMKSSEFVNI